MKQELCKYTYSDPESVTCEIHKEGIILLSGPCALLMQLAHPLIATAIYEHSLVMSHPFHRAVHTIQLTQRKALGSDVDVHHAARTINRLHAHVHGTLAADAGAYTKGTPYRAQDPQLLLWVHATLVVSALRIYELFIGPLSDGEKEQYYQETKARACLLGLPLHVMPGTLVDLEHYVDEVLHSNRLAVTPQARQLMQKVLFPSSSFLLRPLAHFNLFVTSALLPQPVREMFGLQWNEHQQRDFDCLARVLRAVLPSLPECMRELPSTRRMIRQLQGTRQRGAPLQIWANDGPELCSG